MFKFKKEDVVSVVAIAAVTGLSIFGAVLFYKKVKRDKESSI